MASTTRRGLRTGLVALPLTIPLVLAGCGTQHAGSGSAGGSTDLPVLHVGVQPQAMDSMDASDVAGADTTYPLVGTLPTGPTSAVVYRFASSPTGSDLADRLGAALHLSGTPTRHAHGWEVTGDQGWLRLRDDGTWAYWSSRADCPDQVDIDSADGSVTAISCPAPLPTPKDVMTDAEALAAAKPVLAAAGADGTPTVTRYDLVEVSAERTVDGLDVVGGDTSVTVGSSGILSASGTAGTPDAGPAYPIVTAAQALALLRVQPQPAIACIQGAFCPGVGVRHVTGARLGLVPGDDAGTPVLLPAWLFTVKEQAAPIAMMAVQARYLADPDSGSGGGTASASSVPGSSGGGSAASPGSPVPVPPATDMPAPAPSATSAPRSSAVTIDRATLSADGRTLTLWGEGGVCSDYTADSKEDATHVYAVLRATPSKPSGMACPDLAKAVSASVTLDAPLGSRTVVDSGDPAMPSVPVARS